MWYPPYIPTYVPICIWSIAKDDTAILIANDAVVQVSADSPDQDVTLNDAALLAHHGWCIAMRNM